MKTTNKTYLSIIFSLLCAGGLAISAWAMDSKGTFSSKVRNLSDVDDSCRELNSFLETVRSLNSAVDDAFKISNAGDSKARKLIVQKLYESMCTYVDALEESLDFNLGWKFLAEVIKHDESFNQFDAYVFKNFDDLNVDSQIAVLKVCSELAKHDIWLDRVKDIVSKIYHSPNRKIFPLVLTICAQLVLQGEEVDNRTKIILDRSFNLYKDEQAFGLSILGVIFPHIHPKGLDAPWLVCDEKIADYDPDSEYAHDAFFQFCDVVFNRLHNVNLYKDTDSMKWFLDLSKQFVNDSHPFIRGIALQSAELVLMNRGLIPDGKEKNGIIAGIKEIFKTYKKNTAQKTKLQSDSDVINAYFLANELCELQSDESLSQSLTSPDGSYTTSTSQLSKVDIQKPYENDRNNLYKASLVALRNLNNQENIRPYEFTQAIRFSQVAGLTIDSLKLLAKGMQYKVTIDAAKIGLIRCVSQQALKNRQSVVKNL